MANDPQLTLSVLADIKGLQTGMQQAENVVSTTSRRMIASVDSADIGGRFNKQAMIATRAIQGMTSAIQTFSKAQGDAMMLADGLSQSLMMTNNKFAAMGGAALQAGLALNELFTGAQAEAARQREALAQMDVESRIKEQTRDLERQLEIMKETDAIKKIELEQARELALIRQRARREDETAAARAKTAAEEALVREKTRQRIEEARKQAANTRLPQAGLVGSVTTSLGGTFNFAQNAVMQAIQNHAMKQVGLQQSILLTAQQILQLVRNGGTVIT